VDGGVIATATELLEARHYPGVVAMCSDALDDEPDCLPLLLIRARANIALRRELEAQADLRDIIRIDPLCGEAYRLLGVLAERRDEHESAAVFFREAVRLDPDDGEAHDWLQIVDALRPAPAAELPAPPAVAGPLSETRRDPRLARGTQPVAPRDRRDVGRATQPLVSRATAHPPATWSRAMAPATASAPDPALGSAAGGSGRDGQAWKAGAFHIPIEPAAPALSPTLTGPPPTQLPARPAPRSTTRAPTPELPGFGDYLVATGILTHERLRAAQAYQRSMRVQLSTAIVTLGLATPQRIEWAAVAHQSQLARQRQAP
jgi:tetratricopeptide (TPR) repeat protein